MTLETNKIKLCVWNYDFSEIPFMAEMTKEASEYRKHSDYLSGYSVSRVNNFLKDWLESVFGLRSGYQFAWSDEFSDFLKFAEPAFSERNSINLAYFQSADKKMRDIRTPIKPGKFIRRLVPNCPDRVYAEFMDAWREEFDIGKFAYKNGRNFGEVYSTETAKMGNPVTTYYAKSLATSCMGAHHSHDFHSPHPAQAYDSGDFEIHYLLSEDSRLAARSVVCVAKSGTPIDAPIFGPVYGNNDTAIAFLTDTLEAKGMQKGDSGSWSGARLIANSVAPGRYSCVYVDFHNDKLNIETPDSPYIEIQRYGGNLETEYRDGTVYMNRNVERCHDCEDYCDADEIRSHGYHSYCPDCFYERHTACDLCGDYETHDDMATVHSSNGSREWCEGCADCHAVLTHNNELWRQRDCTQGADSEWYSESQIENGDAFYCDFDGELYPMGEECETEDGDTYSRESVDDLGMVEVDGIWFHVPEPDDETTPAPSYHKAQEYSQIAIGRVRRLDLALEAFSELLDWESDIRAGICSVYSAPDAMRTALVAMGQGQACPGTRNASSVAAYYARNWIAPINESRGDYFTGSPCAIDGRACNGESVCRHAPISIAID